MGAPWYIRRPHLKGKRGDFETESNQHQQQAQPEEGLGENRLSGRDDLSKIGRVRHAKNQGDPINHERRRERAENQILDARFQRAEPAALEAGQNIKGDRDQLQGHKNQNEIIGRSGQHHSGQSK